MNWLDMMPEDVATLMGEWGEAKFRAKQIFSWLHKGASVSEMTSLSKALREKMEKIPLGGAKILEKRVSSIDGTAKYLFLLEDGQIVEGVLMHYKHGNTLCISTQVGCRMGCTFCASTLEGLVRNLSAGEMLAEVLAVGKEQQELGNVEKGRRAITNVVLMGSGEPLDNYDEVMRFLKLLHHPDGINISWRNVSLSTCGLPDKIEQLAQDAPGITLCISLHAPDDELRKSMMPIANAYPIDDLMQSARNFVTQTSRRIIFEYALVRGKNDGEEETKKLAKLLRGLQCHVNLIPLNDVKENELKASSGAMAHVFCKNLNDLGISATVRREMGDDIEGACGQLRRGYLSRKEGGI